MNKLIFLVICLLSVLRAEAQLYVGDDNVVAFSSDAPLELIEAVSNSLRCAIQVDERKFAFRVKINSFEGFNSALQQEHFNENYMESNRYPEATFQGRIIESIDFSKPGSYSVRAKGSLIIHGVAQERIVKSQIISDGVQLQLYCSFSVPLDDHDIEVPRIVHQKIAQQILVRVDAELKLRN